MPIFGVRKFVKSKLKAAIGRGDGDDASGASGAMPKGPDKDGFTAVAKVDAVKPGKNGTYVLGTDTVSVFRVGDGSLFAIDDACVHEDGPLGEGTVDGMVVTCPYHDWRYDLRTGDCLSEKDRNVACYAVREKDGFIWVGKKTRDASKARGGEHDDGLNTINLPADA